MEDEDVLYSLRRFSSRFPHIEPLTTISQDNLLSIQALFLAAMESNRGRISMENMSLKTIAIIMTLETRLISAAVQKVIKFIPFKITY